MGLPRTASAVHPVLKTHKVTWLRRQLNSGTNVSVPS